MIYQHLFDRVETPEVVRAGIIGCGDFGSTIVTQARLIPRLEIPIVAETQVERARSVFQQAGVPPENIVVCDSRAEVLRAMEAGRSVIVQDAMLLMELPLQVIATATRVPEAGARYAYEAIQHGKHVVMVDKEADSVVGPMLKRLADRAGLVFTTDDGDQPGLLMGLVSWARNLGLDILCGGNIHNCLYDPLTATVKKRDKVVTLPAEEQWMLERVPGDQVKRYVEARRQKFDLFRVDEACGDPICHMAVSANGTGLLPDRPVGHRPVARLVELPEILCPVEDGGILERRGVIDLPTILRGANEPHGGGGVFIVVANTDAHSREVMIRKGLFANSRRSAMLIYRPYHLCGAETSMSILCAGLLQVPTGSSTILPHVDIAATTRHDFKAGETIGKPGQLGWDRDLQATLIPARPVADGQPLPFFMLESNRLTRDAPTGTVITCEMVAQPEDSSLWRLRARQDETFWAEMRL